MGRDILRIWDKEREENSKEYSIEYTEESTVEYSTDSTEDTLKIFFWSPFSRLTKTISLISMSRYGHCAPSLCGVVFNTTWSQRSGWYRPEHLSHRECTVLDTGIPVSVDVLSNILPKDKPYPVLSTLTSWAVGYPQYPLSCVGATKRALLLAGIPTSGRTPYGIWKELQLHLTGADGPAGQHACPGP